MWEYAVASRLMTLDSVTATECIYCQTALYRFPAKKFDSGEQSLIVQFSLCPCCGWWTVYRVHQNFLPRAREAESYAGAIGSLRELDLTDVSVPLNEVRQYLAARKEKIYEINPSVLEDIVGSIFKGFGYSVRVTGQRIPGQEGDDGIDIILDSSDGTTGIQVRRYMKNRRIEAEQIRSLVGALVYGGHTKGIFVTTSSFRRGAKKTAKRFREIGYPVELIDAKRFFEALGIAQLKFTEISSERINSYVLSPGVHVGSGSFKEFVEGENLVARPVVAMIFTRDELLEVDEDGSIGVAPPDADSPG
jgi:restriction system protein